MKCVICKHGETKDGTTTIILEREGSTIVFKDVPAKICDNCGEKYIDSKVTSSLLLKANKMIAGGVRVEIRNYQLSVA